MKLKVLIALSFAILTIGNSQSQSPALKWTPVIGFQSKAVSAYVEENGYTRYGMYTEKDYSSSVVLLSFDQPQTTEIEDEKIVYRSLAKRIFVECNHGILAPAADFYFAESLPTKDSRPVAVFQYERTPENYSRIDKKSVLFKTVCPAYI